MDAEVVVELWMDATKVHLADAQVAELIRELDDYAVSLRMAARWERALLGRVGAEHLPALLQLVQAAIRVREFPTTPTPPQAP